MDDLEGCMIEDFSEMYKFLDWVQMRKSVEKIEN